MPDCRRSASNRRCKSGRSVASSSATAANTAAALPTSGIKIQRYIGLKLAEGRTPANTIFVPLDSG
jgi:hypothetical protein